MRSFEHLLLHFGDLNVGDEWESAGRTIGRAEVGIFAGLSGDFNPLHVDHVWALSGPYGRPVAHGLLGMSIASGLASVAPRVATLALVEILEWTFLRPIFLDDTVRVINRIEQTEPKAKGRRGLVTWRRRVLNQDDHVVQEGRLRTLVDGRRKRGSTPAE
jgi:3-hydroxybutyryl-CoA dehydratase